MKVLSSLLCALCYSASLCAALTIYHSLDEIKRARKIKETATEIKDIAIKNVSFDFDLKGNCDFKYVTFTNVTFTQQVTSTNFTGSTFNEVTFNAPIEKCPFENCAFNNAIFSKEVTNSTFTDISAQKPPKAKHGILFKAKVADCSFNASKKSKKQLQDITFDGEVIDCTFENAHMINVTFNKKLDDKTRKALDKAASRKNVFIEQHLLAPAAKHGR